MWIIKDLKRMEDLIIELYRLAVANNILDGLARGFRRDLAIFKPDVRATIPGGQYRASMHLVCVSYTILMYSIYVMIVVRSSH
jgi:hypothetical protein